MTTDKPTCFRIDELPKQEQQPLRTWLHNMGKTQLVLDQNDPHAYVFRIDYSEWKYYHWDKHHPFQQHNP